LDDEGVVVVVAIELTEPAKVGIVAMVTVVLLTNPTDVAEAVADDSFKSSKAMGADTTMLSMVNRLFSRRSSAERCCCCCCCILTLAAVYPARLAPLDDFAATAAGVVIVEAALETEVITGKG
jgi:hypothetical protein